MNLKKYYDVVLRLRPGATISIRLKRSTVGITKRAIYAGNSGIELRTVYMSSSHVVPYKILASSRYPYTVILNDFRILKTISDKKNIYQAEKL